MQILFLLAGIPFVAIGTLIVLSEAKSRAGAIAVPGRIVGFSRAPGESGESYHVVAEYAGADGQHRLIESAVGSSSPMGRVGDALQILVRPDDPENAAIKSYATYVIGIVLMLMGAVSCWVFLATFRLNPVTLVTSIVVTGLCAYKLNGVLDRLPASMQSWAALKKAIQGRVYPAAARDQIAWADTATLDATRRRQMRANRFTWLVLVLGGIALVFLGRYLYQSTAEFLARAVPASGRVVELAPNNSSDTVTYSPVVEFEAGGERHRFKDSVGSDPPSYRSGDQVPILYDPADPRRARIDRGIWNRAVPILVGVFGALLALTGLWIRPR